MRTIIFATNNSNKVSEIKAALPADFRVTSLKDAGITIEIPEPHDTLEANAKEKSTTIFKLTGKDCFSEDTGLEVQSLDGAPGVKSARYAGDNNDPERNIAKLLANLANNNNRNARFRTVISLILNGNEYQFEGICNGTITKEKSGSAGFGYDAVFIPFGSELTFAEMDITEKNKFSHRKKALIKLIAFLNQHDAKDKD